MDGIAGDRAGGDRRMYTRRIYEEIGGRRRFDSEIARERRSEGRREGEKGAREYVCEDGADPDTVREDREHRERSEAERERRSEGAREVGTFTWMCFTIANPFKDETARFPVTPQRYGFEITHTGGGCTAWVRDEGSDLELWVTGLDADAATCDCRGWIIGLYYVGNDELEPIWCMTVREGVRDIDIADPDPRTGEPEKPDDNSPTVTAVDTGGIMEEVRELQDEMIDLGGIETAANEQPIKNDMQTIQDITVKAAAMVHEISDILTGRDTHPLFDGYGKIDPARFYVGVESEKILTALFGLERYLDQLNEHRGDEG